MSSRPRQRHGFTVPELLVAIAISGIILVGLISLFVGLANNSAAVIKTSDQIRNNNTVISSIESDMRLTKSFRATASLADSDSTASPIQPSGWVFRGIDSNSRILILQTYATTTNSKADERQIVYRDDGLGGCPVGLNPVYNNIIYFLKDDTLYRRTLVEATPPPSTQYCGSTPTDSVATISQKQTCTDGQASGMPSNCREKDVALAKGITQFSIQYYQNPSDSTTLNSVYSMTDTDANTALSGTSSLRIDVTTKGESTANIADIASYRRLSKGALRVF